MTKKVKPDSEESMVEFIAKVLKENEEFLRKNAKETYDEVSELVNDAIDYAILFVTNDEWKEEYIKSSIIGYTVHMLMPLSYAVYMDLLAANVVACFMELRLMLESLVKCYYADLRYPKKTFFAERIELLEKELDRQRKSTSKLIKEFGRNAASLWGKLSEDWLHTRGVINRIVTEAAERGIPAWSVPIPASYTETDLKVIDELRKRISKFREILDVTIEDWKSKVRSQKD